MQKILIKSITNKSIYGDYYINLFAASFDNVLTPVFAVNKYFVFLIMIFYKIGSYIRNFLFSNFKFIICLWGAFFVIAWQRENARLAFEWDVTTYETDEPDRPEYTRHEQQTKEKIKDKSYFFRTLWNQEKYFKIFVSYCVLFFMVGIFIFSMNRGNFNKLCITQINRLVLLSV